MREEGGGKSEGSREDGDSKVIGGKRWWIIIETISNSNRDQ